MHGSHHNSHEPHDKHVGHSPGMFKKKFWLSLGLTIPVLVFSGSVQDWLGYSLEFNGSQYISAIFGVILFWYAGLVFLRGAKHEIANRQPGMMSLISMAILVAFGYSLAITLNLLDGMDFWWELATLITIMIFGHWMEMAAVQNAQGALKELAKLLPDEAELITEKGTKKIAPSELRVGDLVLVRPGAKIPADGRVAKGESDVNESMLTGESKSVKKTIGEDVVAGTINGSGSLRVEVTKVGGDTVLAGIMKLVSEAQKSKSKSQVLADRAAFYLTFVALGAALITFASWLIFSEQSTTFITARVVTVLVIACPHALGLAIPLVTAISTTKAAKNGLLIRERMAQETAKDIDVILFDKTGTLTRGEQGVVDMMALGDENHLLALAGAVESESEHPIARAIVASADERGVDLPKSTGFSALSGRGAKATVNGKAIHVGGPRLLEELEVKLAKDMEKTAKEAGKTGKTVVYVIKDKEVLGAIMLADVIRDESKEAISELMSGGKRVAMLTGDSEEVAKWVAGELGIREYFAEVLPEHKADAVKKLQSDGSKVAMVGDGVNDAPALTQADVGIAIGAGTDVAIESAGIVLASSDPRGVAKVVKLSKATYRKMQQNLVWATGYNIVAIPLAGGVLYSYGILLAPAVGAILMSLSTIIVAVNAQLLRKVEL